MRIRRVLVIVAAMVLLVGCGGSAEPEPAPVDTTEPAPEPDPEPDPEPAPDPHPDLADLVISTSGLGPLTVGAPAEGNSGEAMIEWDAEYCVSELWEGDEPGRWAPAGYGTDTAYHGEQTQPFYLDVLDGEVVRVDVMGITPRTAEGVGIDTPLGELQATYPELQGPHADVVSRVWWLQDEHGTLVFETQGDADGLRPAGTEESVILIRVLAPGLDPAWGAANSGNVAGACF